MNWQGRNVAVLGGASFLGSHLVEALVERGAKVSVTDDLSSGKLENIHALYDARKIRFLQMDLRNFRAAVMAVKDAEIVFHLAADHGGRGYVDLHQAACATNLILDGTIFRACVKARVGKVVFASSGCVYPNHLQTDPSQELYLTEELVGPPYDADKMYGWAKLMGELSLRAYYQDYGLRSASARIFTAYGPRGKEDHAIMAMIGRAFIGQDPFEIWGTGQQVRNWTYVTDIVRGLILLAEHVDDAQAINLGTMERTTVFQAARMVCDAFGHAPNFKFLPEMPTGPLNRIADNSAAKALLGWAPEVPLTEGIDRTVSWYVEHRTREEVAARLPAALTER